MGVCASLVGEYRVQVEHHKLGAARMGLLGTPGHFKQDFKSFTSLHGCTAQWQGAPNAADHLNIVRNYLQTFPIQHLPCSFPCLLLQVVNELAGIRAARARLEGWASLADKQLSGTSAGGYGGAVSCTQMTSKPLNRDQGHQGAVAGEM
jgi:uncharacterized protein YhdP